MFTRQNSSRAYISIVSLEYRFNKNRFYVTIKCLRILRTSVLVFATDHYNGIGHSSKEGDVSRVGPLAFVYGVLHEVPRAQLTGLRYTWQEFINEGLNGNSFIHSWHPSLIYNPYKWLFRPSTFGF